MTRIGLIQMRCEKGAIEANLDEMLQHIHEAVRRGIQIVAFPEMSITGYADPAKYPEALLQLDGPEVAQLVQATQGLPITVLGGLIEENGAAKPFITQIVVRGGQLAGYYRKRTIRDEEVDWFTPGQSVPVFQEADLTYGVAICADIEDEQVFAEIGQRKARLVFEVAAPGLYGEQATRDWRSGFQWWEEKCQLQLGSYARKYGLWIAVATQAGRTADEDFPGGGYVFAPDGRRLFATPDWSPGAVFLDLDLEKGILREA